MPWFWEAEYLEENTIDWYRLWSRLRAATNARTLASERFEHARMIKTRIMERLLMDVFVGLVDPCISQYNVKMQEIVEDIQRCKPFSTECDNESGTAASASDKPTTHGLVAQELAEQELSEPDTAEGLRHSKLGLEPFVEGTCYFNTRLVRRLTELHVDITGLDHVSKDPVASQLADRRLEELNKLIDNHPVEKDRRRGIAEEARRLAKFELAEQTRSKSGPSFLWEEGS